MKKNVSIILFLLVFVLSSARAQTPYLIVEQDSTITPGEGIVMVDTTKVLKSRSYANVVKKDTTDLSNLPMYGWHVDSRSGERTFVNTDKGLFDFHQSSLVDGQDIAVGYLGNLGSPAQSKLFFERESDASIFPFLDAFSYYRQTPENNVFLNTKVPYSNIFYQTAGGKVNSEERFTSTLSTNFGKKINVGFNIDYIYSRGFYSYLSNKQIAYNVYGSYISDRYQMHAYVANNYYNNSENGGIFDTRYITDPTNPELTVNISDSKSIPVRIGEMWNRLKGKQLFMSNRYNLGYERQTGEEPEAKEFIPVASFILTTRYTDQQRRFASEDNSIVSSGTNETGTDLLYDNNYYTAGGRSNTPATDQMAYWSFKNTFAISLNEGFKEWVKFGLMAYIEQDFRKFSVPSSTFAWPMVLNVHSQNSTVIGGRLTKEKGRFLKYNLDAQLGVLGANIGETKLEGDISTTIRIAGKDAIVRAKGYIKNLTPTFYQETYQTKYLAWDNELDDTRRVFIGGEIVIPHTNTRISGGVENIKNHIYYNQSRLIDQSNKDIQVVSVRLDQKLKAGIFHWDNQVAYQTSTEESVIPLPKLSLYSNIYLLANLGKVLTIQLGADAHFHTKYYAPGYEPALLQFYNQRDTEIGGFPIATAYINVNLKKSRFYAMMYNIGESLGNSEYFSLPNYPVNPMIFKMGISWDFSN